MKFHSENNIPIKVLDNTLFSNNLLEIIFFKRISQRVNIYIYASFINKQLEIKKVVYTGMLIIVLEICVCFVYSYQ